MPYETLDDAAFDRTVTLRDAYRIMEHFVGAFVARGDLPTVAFLDYLGITRDGGTGDPAAIPDFLASAAAVVGYPGAATSSEGRAG